MKEVAMVLLSALLSGILATVILLLWQGYNEKKKRQYEIFAALMGLRFALPNESTVRCMNMIDIVFYKNKKIRQRYKEFLDEVNKPENGTRDIDEKILKLLEAMAESLGYKDVQWDTIKHTYFPVGLAEKYRDEDALRKLQIHNLARQAQSPQNHVAR